MLATAALDFDEEETCANGSLVNVKTVMAPSTRVRKSLMV